MPLLTSPLVGSPVTVTTTTIAPTLTVVTRFTGEVGLPQDIKRRRRNVYDAMRRFGTPVIVKHMFNADDVQSGLAQTSSNFNNIYGQSRRDDPLSYGVGYCSVELSTSEWLSPDGRTIVVSATSPGSGYTPAPRYRGFDKGYITWVIMPDVKEDIFKPDKAGALIKIQNAQAQAPWSPKMADNDLLVTVELDDTGAIARTVDRYQLKMTNPVTMRGRDKRGRTEQKDIGGNRFVINQIFELARVPTNDILFKVETDR